MPHIVSDGRSLNYIQVVGNDNENIKAMKQEDSKPIEETKTEEKIEKIEPKAESKPIESKSIFKKAKK